LEWALIANPRNIAIDLEPEGFTPHAVFAIDSQISKIYEVFNRHTFVRRFFDRLFFSEAEHTK
jgi:hypothetical protein